MCLYITKKAGEWINVFAHNGRSRPHRALTSLQPGTDGQQAT